LENSEIIRCIPQLLFTGRLQENNGLQPLNRIQVSEIRICKMSRNRGIREEKPYNQMYPA
jgi:hypothetical protein